MRYRSVTTFMFAWLLMSQGCDWENHGPNTTEPRWLDYHQHLVVMHIRTINRASDTLGTTSVAVNSGDQSALRDRGEELTRNYVFLGSLPISMQVVYPDSEVHTCSTYIDHYVGYQTKYGGDTTRYGKMDRYGPWAYRLTVGGGTATFAARDSAQVDQSLIDMVPDTVRPGSVLELDIVVDASGLLQWRQSISAYYLNPDRIHITQR